MIFKSFDDKEIYIHEWLDVEKPVGIVQIIHGMVEHAGRYDNFAKYLNEHGYLVIADDHRGHGKTDEDHLGYSSGNMFEDTVRDEIEITKYYQKKFSTLKYFILGFSYGSFITQSYIAQNGFNIEGAVIAGSNYKKDLEVYLGSALALIGPEKMKNKLIERLSFGQYERRFVDRNWYAIDSSENEFYDGYDPYQNFVPSNRFYRDFFKGLKKLYTKEYIEELNKNLPLLLVSGEDDPVGEMGKGVEKLYDFYVDKAGMKNVSMVLFEHSRHEFLNEKVDRGRKWATILNFFIRNT